MTERILSKRFHRPSGGWLRAKGLTTSAVVIVVLSSLLILGPYHSVGTARAGQTHPTYYSQLGYEGNYSIYPTQYMTPVMFPSYAVNGTVWQSCTGSTCNETLPPGFEGNTPFPGLTSAMSAVVSEKPGEHSQYGYLGPQWNSIWALWTWVSFTGGSSQWCEEYGYGTCYNTYAQDASISLSGLPPRSDSYIVLGNDTGLNVTTTGAGGEGNLSQVMKAVMDVGLTLAGFAFPEIGIPLAGLGLMDDFIGPAGVQDNGPWGFSSTLQLSGADGTMNQYVYTDNGSMSNCNIDNCSGTNVYSEGIWVQTLIPASELVNVAAGSMAISGENILQMYVPGLSEGIYQGATTSTIVPIAPAISMGGTVTLYSGGPVVPNAQVTLQQDYGGTYTNFVQTTNATGYWHFFAEPGATYNLTATFTTPLGTASSGVGHIAPSLTSTSAEGTDFTIPVSVGGGEMSGQITSASTGLPIAGASIVINNSNCRGCNPSYEEVYSNSNGDYSVMFPVAASSSDPISGVICAGGGTYVCQDPRYTTLPTGTDTVKNFALALNSGGGGGGCVAWGTPILTPSGYVPIQSLRFGAAVDEYNLSTASMTAGSFRYGNVTNVTSLIDVNHGLLYLTPTDQPVYVQNSSYQGWLRDPQNLTTADRLFDPVAGSWIQVRSVQLVHQKSSVYDVVTTGLNNFIANGVLLDSKH
jgi:hypothetical protein